MRRIAFERRGSRHSQTSLLLLICMIAASAAGAADAQSHSKVSATDVTDSAARANLVSVKTKKSLLRAEELEALGEYKQAVELFSNAIRENPDIADLYGRRGKCYINLNEFDKAIADLTKLIKLAPDSPSNPYLHRGRCYQKLDQNRKAITDFTAGIKSEEKGRKKQGKLFSLYMARGRSYELSGEYANALKDYDRCLQYKGGTTDGGTVRMWRSKLSAKIEASKN